MGNKCQCARCGRRYYDLKKNPPSCPFCEAVFDAEQLWRHNQPATFGRPGYSDYSDAPDSDAPDEVSAAVGSDEMSHEELEIENDDTSEVQDDASEVQEVDSSVDPAERNAGSE